MDTNTNLLKSIQTMVQEQVNSAPYDKTRNAIVTANLTGGYYSIIMDGVEYPRVKAYGLADNFTVNSTVKVVIPGNQASQMYIASAGKDPDLSSYATKTELQAETTARQSADTTLQNNITAEATTRANTDTTLQGDITTEANNRQNADNNLANLISAEANTRADADTTLQTNIDTKVAKGDSNINIMNKSVLLDFFYPIGTIYETADSTFNPATAWGGTWELIQGKVLVGSGDTDIGAIGTSGGNKGSFYHTHGSKSLSGRFALRRYATSSELLNTIFNASGICSTSDTGTTYGTTFDADATDAKGQFVTIDATHEHDAVGDSANTNATISNMPPYEVVNIWKRIAPSTSA